jgi:hypothetical protein
MTILVLAASCVTEAARAEESRATATMQCDRAPEPGRVRCSVEARGTGGRSLAWADVALVELPSFAAALKGRIGPDGVVARDATSEKWAFGVVARSAGQGEARARVRMLVCDPPAPGSSDAGTTHCQPVTIDVRATLNVG